MSSVFSPWNNYKIKKGLTYVKVGANCWRNNRNFQECYPPLPSSDSFCQCEPAEEEDDFSKSSKLCFKLKI